MPVRTCIGCRRQATQNEMLRLALGPEGSVGEWRGSGRSAYVCADQTCIDQALSRGRLERALRTRINQAEREALESLLKCKLR